MTDSLSSSTQGIALFIDIENFINACSSSGLSIRLKPITQKLQEIAPVRLRRAYGDIIQAVSATTSSHGQVMAGITALRKELFSNNVTIEDIPYLQQHKNSADMILTSAALALAYEKPYLTHFAFISNDKDYIPLYLKLREMGKFIIAVCVDANNTSSRIIDSVDALFYYEDIVSSKQIIPRAPEQPNPAQEKFDSGLRDSFDLLIRAYKSLESEGRTPVLLAQLVPKMRQIRADFDYSRFGFSKFLDFLAAAKEANYIELNRPDNGGLKNGWQIELSARARSDAPQSISTDQVIITGLENEDKPGEIIKLYTQVLENLLKLKFPNVDIRRRILNACLNSQEVLPLPLQEFANHVAGAASDDYLKKVLSHEKLIFKILLSLYYAKAFSIEYVKDADAYLNNHNPYLISLIYSQVHELENRLEIHFAKNIKNHFKHLPRAADLARLFYGDSPSAEQIQHCEEIVDEIRYWE
jgi:hypothetical protein